MTEESVHPADDGGLIKQQMLNDENNNNIKNSTIQEYFAYKNVFVTGGTGFLGTVLIEALLSSSPNIGNIYVLVRDKYGANANLRIQKMISKQIFAGHSEETLKKIIPIIGELSELQLGINDEMYRDLCENVNIIYHSAATIKFNSHLRTAITINLIGTMRTIEFAKQLKNLSSYIYLSTAFCNSNYRGFIQEKIYPCSCDPYEMIRLAENDGWWTNTNEILVKSKNNWEQMIDGHPNTYTFTKQLAENLILQEMSGLPTGIVRPSVVYGTYKDPVEGWVGSANSGHLGFLAGYSKGLFRTIIGNSQSVIDIIPCDYVINSSLTMCWYVGTRKLDIPEVIHCSSGESNPLTLGRFRDILNESVSKNPCDLLVWKPGAKLRNGLRYTLYFYLFHLIPSIFLYIPEKKLSFRKPHHTSLEYMRVFDKGTKAFDYFLTKDFRYSLKNSIRIMSLLQSNDVDRYRYDAADIDYTILFERCLLGLRRYHFRESYKTRPRHHIMFKIYQIIHYISMIFLLACLYFGITPLLGSTTLSMVIILIIWLFLVWL